jgi:hypothetical protein
LNSASCFLSRWLLQSHTSSLSVVEDHMNAALGYTQELQDPEYTCRTHYEFARVMDRVYQSLVSKRKFFEFEHRFQTHDRLKTHIDTVKAEMASRSSSSGSTELNETARKAMRRHVRNKEAEYKRDEIEIQELNMQISRCLEHAVVSYLQTLLLLVKRMQTMWSASIQVAATTEKSSSQNKVVVKSVMMMLLIMWLLIV